MFIFGTNDFGQNRCDEDGCVCVCETGAKDDGTCNMISHDGYNLYKFKTRGNYALFVSNLNIIPNYYKRKLIIEGFTHFLFSLH